ncbi:hypothetical protein M758_UG301500 [Ceratodon purpureus]|nr:hypothetical protein M758_UG301500 [Ceratodon purpureus]
MVDLNSKTSRTLIKHALIFISLLPVSVWNPIDTHSEYTAFLFEQANKANPSNKLETAASLHGSG